MDTQVIIQILTLAGGLGTPAFFIIKSVLKDRTDTTNFDRSQIIPTKEWLLREAALNKRIDDLETKVDQQREAYEKRLSDKNIEMATMERTHREELKKRDTELEAMKVELAGLQHQVKNVRATQLIEADVRKLERETATGEIRDAVDTSMQKMS